MTESRTRPQDECGACHKNKEIVAGGRCAACYMWMRRNQAAQSAIAQSELQPFISAKKQRKLEWRAVKIFGALVDELPWLQQSGFLDADAVATINRLVRPTLDAFAARVRAEETPAILGSVDAPITPEDVTNGVREMRELRQQHLGEVMADTASEAMTSVADAADAGDAATVPASAASRVSAGAERERTIFPPKKKRRNIKTAPVTAR